jgi:hypothetical protein
MLGHARHVLIWDLYRLVSVGRTRLVRGVSTLITIVAGAAAKSVVI